MSMPRNAISPRLPRSRWAASSMMSESIGGIIWGLSATLSGEIDFKQGSPVQSSFTDFEVVRMDEAPAIETHIVASDHPPGGFGETAVPPVAPAVVNAIFSATGKRIRRLPVKRANNEL
jgi:isoquinoline 1-oxidoreductase subunit beta